MWQLSYPGTLKNSHSGLCASINTVKANSESGGVCSWIATGREGEIYLAFFNLNAEKTEICAKKSDQTKALPGKDLTNVTLMYKDVWTHGWVLFVLNC
ncbi:Poly(A) RNA polymerase, partial [Actinidia chinensis var. chinensis]